MPPRADFKWKPIEKWTGPWKKSDLPEVYLEFRNYLDKEGLDKYRDRAAREWSIETGQIEGAYDIDDNTTSTLIMEGFHESLINEQRNGLSKEKVHAILLDARETLDTVLEFAEGTQPLSVHFIRALHQKLMKNFDTYTGTIVDPSTSDARRVELPLDRGGFKKHPNHIRRLDGSILEFCPPEFVEEQMEQLVRLLAEMETEGAPADVLSAWLHFHFVSIHPFQDGNGRVARAIASMVLFRGGLPTLTVVRSMKRRYIQALEQTSSGNPTPLLEFFQSALYRQTFLLWSELRLKPVAPIPEDAPRLALIVAARDKLRLQSNKLPASWDASNQNIARLRAIASQAMQDLSNELAQVLRPEGIQISGVGTSKWPPNIASTCVTQEWVSVSASKSTADVQADVVSIPGGPKVDFIVFYDRFHEERAGIGAVTVAYRSGEEALHVSRPFFVTFKPPDEAAFKAWLEKSLAQAVYLWQESI
jgi:fido (protein-threonine AMPylation protein)